MVSKEVKEVKEEMLDAAGAESPLGISFIIFNRGRRPIHVLRLQRVKSAFADITEISMLPNRSTGGATIDEGRSRSYRLTDLTDAYSPGDLPVKRWYFLDEAGRTFPLRERYRQRVERIVFWPTRKLYDWRLKRQRA